VDADQSKTFTAEHPVIHSRPVNVRAMSFRAWVIPPGFAVQVRVCHGRTIGHLCAEYRFWLSEGDLYDDAIELMNVRYLWAVMPAGTFQRERCPEVPVSLRQVS
jgi:hypothetical protein